MPIYEVTDPNTGVTLELTGDSPPTEQELEEVFKTVSAQPAPAPANPIQQADSQLMQAVNRSAGMADPLLNFARQAQQPQVSGEATSQYMNPARFRGEDVAPPPVATSEEDKKRIQQGLANIPRYGVPIAAGAMTGGLAAGPAAALVGGASIAGEISSQGIEKIAFEKPFRPGEVVKSAVVGATPVLAPIQGASGPLAAAIFQAGKQALVNAGSSAFASTLQKYIDEGRLPTSEEIAKDISIPAIVGAVTGGAAGALARNQRALTAEEEIAQQGAQASRQLENVLGEGSAPLTATQQTGRNVPGTFGPGSAGLSSQQALPARIRQQLDLPEQQVGATAQVAQQEMRAAETASRENLRARVSGAGGQAVAVVEDVIGSILPRSPRAASLQDAANYSVGFIRGEEQRLSGIVDNAYSQARNALATRLAGQAETPVAPSQRLTDTIDEVLGTLATEERRTTVPSPIIGGEAREVVERIPSQFFNEASSRARALLDVARSPQTFEQIVGLRQSIDRVIHQFQEFAPGVAQNQLRRLRSALKQEELDSARRLGIENEIVSAQRAAENRFSLLQDNQIIRKATIPASEGGYQNTEQFFSELSRSPAAFESVRNLLSSTAQGRIQFNQIRRGFIDSLRSAGTVDIGGVPTESLSTFANNFRELPQGVKNIVAGSEANANRLQSILNDAVRVQNVGMSIPVASGISQQSLTEITDNIGNIQSPNLRQTVENLARQARVRSEQFFNSTTRRVQNNQLNPDTDPTQFVRDFVFRSQNPEVVQNALAQLSPATREAVRANAAVAVLNHVSETGPANLRRGVQNLDDIVRDQNRMQIIREVLDPADYDMINNYMLWNRARNLTEQGGRLEPDRLANSVMRATRARWIVDSLVGSPAVQDFLASAIRLPRQFGQLKPNLTAQEAQSLARSANMTLIQFNREWDRLNEKSEQAKQSLPEDKRMIFDDSLGIPSRSQ